MRERLESGQRFAHVASPVAEPKVIARVPELRCRHDEHALPFDEDRGEFVDVASKKFWEANASSAWTNPSEGVGVSREELTEELEIRAHNGARSFEDAILRPQRDECQDLAWRAAANRRV